MRAITYRRYGGPDVLTPAELDRPPGGPTDVLVRVHASTVSTGDWRLRASAFPAPFWLPSRLMFGLFAPRHPILGVEMAGEVVEVGAEVTRFGPGDRVFGYCGRGGNAEFVAMPEDGPIALTPDHLSSAEAAAIPNGGLCARYFLETLGELKAGERVLINGASGGIGAYAVQLAFHLGAHVTGVASAANLGLVESLGAHEVVDYRKEDFTRRGERYDVILDAVGNQSFGRARTALSPRGRLVLAHFDLSGLWQAWRMRNAAGPRVLAGVLEPSRADFLQVAERVRTGAICPVIDRTYSLDEAARAHAYVEQGHKRGSVVLQVRPEVARGLAAA